MQPKDSQTTKREAPTVGLPSVPEEHREAIKVAIDTHGRLLGDLFKKLPPGIMIDDRRGTARKFIQAIAMTALKAYDKEGEIDADLELELQEAQYGYGGQG